MRDEDVEVEQEEEKTEHPDILSEHRMEDLRRHAEDLKEFDKGINAICPCGGFIFCIIGQLIIHCY